MSHAYSTRKFLNIKNKTIIFPEDYFEEVQLNGITSFVFKGILSYQPVHCEHGGTLFDSNFKNHRRKVKRYGRLFLKSPTLIDTTTYLSIYCFKQPMCEIDILNFLLDLSPELKATYDLYQDLLFALQTKNLTQLNH